jgi:adenylosuccinate lyase
MKFDHNNISPLDSRYANKITNFRENFSESALIKIRFEIEIEWILYLCSITSKNIQASIKKFNRKNN